MLRIKVLIHRTNPANFALSMQSFKNLQPSPEIDVEVKGWHGGLRLMLETQDGRELKHTIENGTYLDMLTTSDIYNEQRREEKLDYIILLRDNVCLMEKNFWAIFLDLIEKYPNLAALSVFGQTNDELIGSYYYRQEGEIAKSTYGNPGLVDAEYLHGDFLILKADLPMRKSLKEDMVGAYAALAAKLHRQKAAVIQMAKPLVLFLEEPSFEYFCFNYQIQREKELVAKLLNSKEVLLTIGVPTYNRARFLEKCLANIYDQVRDLACVEVLVSNDASTDETEAVVKLYLDKANFSYYRNEKNMRFGNTLAVFDKAQGKFMVVTGDDDYYNDGIILTILETIVRNEDIAIIGIDHITGGGLKLERHRGLDEYMFTYQLTFTTVNILNRKYYLEVDASKKDYTNNYPHVNPQLEMIKKHGDFIFLRGARALREDSGEYKLVGNDSDRQVFKKEKQVPYGRVFVKEHFELFEPFVNDGISQEAFSKQKYFWWKTMAVPYLSRAKAYASRNEQDRYEYYIDDDIEELCKSLFETEKFYPEVQEFLARLLDK